jgi:hypothetical protein
LFHSAFAWQSFRYLTQLMPRPSTFSRKNHRRHVSLPGVLQRVLHQRYLEFRYPTFSPYGLELACFDLRLRRAHDLTVVFAQADKNAQEALDCLLARHYTPGPDARGLLVRAVPARQRRRNRDRLAMDRADEQAARIGSGRVVPGQ